MSQQTAKLMGISHRCGSVWPDVLGEITRRLVNEYGTPTLGNFRSPVKEIFYILLSARTTEVLFKRAHRRLFLMYPNLKKLAGASVEDVFGCINAAGLGRKKSKQIVDLAQRLCCDLGNNPNKKIRAMTANEAFNYLTSLPGVGPKSAFCVMMYSLDLDVFPVDVNVQRIAERVGVIRSGTKHYVAQRRLPKYVPDGCSKKLHIAMIVHGRNICVPIRPKCDQCMIADLCKQSKRVEQK